MNKSMEKKILELRNHLDDADMYLGPNGSQEDIDWLSNTARHEFSIDLPKQYLDFLKKHDGLIAGGVFIYSSRPHKFPDSEGHSHSFIDLNLIAQDLDIMKGYLIFGESDQEEYVLDLSKNKYQVRDNQAFDNIYEEFDSFDELLEFMIDLIIKQT